MELYGSVDDAKLSKILGVGISFLQKKAEELELEKEEIEEWSDKDMELVVKLYSSTPNERLSELLGRSKMEIDHFAFRLGLEKNDEFFVNIFNTETELDLIDQWNEEYNKKEHGNSRGNFLLDKVLTYLFPRSQLLSEYPIGGLRLDFYLPSLAIGFEFDGIQHKEFNSFFYKTKADFVRAQNRDYSKSEMAEVLGIAVVRFSYNEELNIGLVRAKIAEVV